MDNVFSSNFVTAILAFVSVFLLTIALGQVAANWQLKRIAASKLRQVGLGRKISKAMRLRKERKASPRLSALLQSLSNLALPAGGWQDDNTKLKFFRAGLRHEKIRQIYFSLKTVLTAAPPLIALLVLLVFNTELSIAWIAVITFTSAVTGYYGPDLYLRWKTASRQTEMRNVLPDLIDLLVICTESGLALDQAIYRVAREIQRSSPALAEEFYLLALEVRAGAARASAMRNLALRIDIDEVNTLVSMLIQADRFGTSIADALRVQSEISRVKRMQRAEEIAAKIPTKMLLPLILLIFPALMMVLLGPAVLQIIKAFAD